MNKATKRIQSTIKIRNAVGLKGESWDNQAIARDVLFDELGYNRVDRPHYSLDDQTKDILLAHARQDASHALGNTISLLERVEKLDRTVRILCVFVVSAGITIAYLLWKIVQNSQI
ncbi:hypothetical protein [Methylobacterium trifolii]|uniref:Uncharacterized protein n=1 Tax=Methylobacterium trifolii TaxID=1003092 RepID=A0ABQ4U0Y0_9HYPH|nr:hypothetical protein [Methylobacterium trifolii]GJE59948.1 hypothetical protein MPOCJGCO_2056 [Methylobacterium trifolii]